MYASVLSQTVSAVNNVICDFICQAVHVWLATQKCAGTSRGREKIVREYYPRKRMPFLFPSYYILKNAQELLNKISPVTQITACNKLQLERSEYVVGPKADGTRAVLLCEYETGSFYLLRHSRPPTLVPGEVSDQNVNGLKGFALDVEIIESFTGGQMILAFDICAGYDIFADYNLMYKSTRPTYLERRQILRKIIKESSIPNLQIKPIAPSNQAALMWDIWRGLPYAIDGLIFTKVKGEFGDICYKWKPTNHLTLDVALGEPIFTDEERSYFVAHIKERSDLLFEASKDAIMKCDILLESGYCILNSLNIQGLGDALAGCPNPSEILPRVTGYYDIGDIEQTHLDDNCRIEEERIAESKFWKKGTHLCSMEKCPCSCSDILHCRKCGALGVGTHEFTCLGSCGWLGSSTPNEDVPVVVPVPIEHTAWATFGVVEVNLLQTSKGISLKFKRIRHDKKQANSIGVANDILQEFVDPILLSDINFKTVECVVPSTRSYRSLRKTSTSKFMELRKLHHLIKEWLYTTYGGPKIIDACAGSLSDLSNWKSAQIVSVLAAEADEDQYRKGLTRIEDSRKQSEFSLPEICSIQEDLSKPTDLSTIDMLQTPVDTIFCNFAIHYFWSSKEETKTFLNNLLPHLKDGGRFVVTFLQGEAVKERGSFQIFNENDILEFEAKKVNEKKVNIYVASIGNAHDESIITRSDMESRFKDAGLDLVSWLPFERLRQMFKDTLSDEEKQMSSLYAAAVFEKGKKQSFKQGDPSRYILRNGLLPACSLPAVVEMEILQFFAVPDLVKCRLLSRPWLHKVDSMDVNHKVKRDYFRSFRYKPETKENILSTNRSMALFLRMGGYLRRLEPWEDSDEPESLNLGGYEQQYDDYSDHGWQHNNYGYYGSY